MNYVRQQLGKSVYKLILKINFVVYHRCWGGSQKAVLCRGLKWCDLKELHGNMIEI